MKRPSSAAPRSPERAGNNVVGQSRGRDFICAVESKRQRLAQPLSPPRGAPSQQLLDGPQSPPRLRLLDRRPSTPRGRASGEPPQSPPRSLQPNQPTSPPRGSRVLRLLNQPQSPPRGLLSNQPTSPPRRSLTLRLLDGPQSPPRGLPSNQPTSPPRGSRALRLLNQPQSPPRVLQPHQPTSPPRGLTSNQPTSPSPPRQQSVPPSSPRRIEGAGGDATGGLDDGATTGQNDAGSGAEKENEPPNVSVFSKDDPSRSGEGEDYEEYDSNSSGFGDDEADDSLALVPTQGQKMQYNSAVEEVLTEYFYDTHAAEYATTTEKYEFLKRERRSGKLGPKSQRHLAWAYAQAHESVRALEKYAPAGAQANASDNQRRSWWNDRVNAVVPEKVTHMSGTSRQLGSIHLRKFALLSAIEADRLKLGPWLVFQERTPDALSFLRAMQASKPVPGRFGGFTERSAHPIALRKIQLLMNVFSNEIDHSVSEILGGSSLEAFLRRYNSPAGLAALEELSVARAIELSESIALEPGETIIDAIRRLGNLIWLNLTNIIVTYNDIVAGLVRSIFGVYPGADGEVRLWMSLAALMIVQHCIGAGTVALGFDPEDFERLVESCGSVVFEIFGHSNEPLVFDLAARSDPSARDDDDEGDADAYRKVPIPGTGRTRFARRISVFETDGDGLTTFSFTVRKSDKIGLGKSQKEWKLHRVYQIALEHHGLGFRNSSLVREYLGLEDGESFEDVDRFAWSTGNAAYVERRLKHLEKKGWKGKRLAKWSDIDHCVGRSKAWMNCPLFTIHCSHSWNQCMSYLRIRFGDWGWGLAPKKYGTGND